MATELAKAYVQIVPSARGIKGSITKAFAGEADSAGTSIGSTLASKIKGVLAEAGIGAALAKTLTEGAALQQSIGGVETLFADSAEKVIASAQKAYQSAGLSANSYMETITGFSARLLQGLGGDTEEAARLADMAITDMADNANKMGTDMQSIQDTYQSLARGNYEMLDNLKLGYGGTQAEMARLINESGVLGDTMEATAENVNSIGFDKIIQAIHTVQEEMGITGTTAQEAATTLSGSFNAMKAAAQNVLGQITLGQDIQPALNGLAQTVTTFLVGNLIPAIWNIISALPGAFVTFIQTLIPQLSTAFMQFFPTLQTGISTGLSQMMTGAQQMSTIFLTGLSTYLPQILTKGTEIITNLVSGIFAALPQIAQSAWEAQAQFANTIFANLPNIIESGKNILLSIVEGIGNALPQLLVIAGQAIATMVSGLVQNLPQIISSGFDLIVSLIQGIGNALPDIITAAGEVASTLWDEIKNVDWLQLGKDIISGLINGIGAMAGALWDAATSIASSALDAIKSFFGIGSPSKVMAREVGHWLPPGIAVGMEDNMRPLTNALNYVANTTSEALRYDLSRDLAQPAYTAAGPQVALYQTINTHDSLSPAEMTREAQNMLKRARWALP